MTELPGGGARGMRREPRRGGPSTGNAAEDVRPPRLCQRGWRCEGEPWGALSESEVPKAAPPRSPCGRESKGGVLSPLENS